MSYLIQADYKRQIQLDNLHQIVGSDASVLSFSELAAQEEIISYLTQKYDLSLEFTATFLWDVAKAYNAGDRVVDANGLLYFACNPQPIFIPTAVYKKADQAFWKNKIYTALQGTRAITHELQIQYHSTSDIPAANVFPDDPANGATYWGTGASYQVAAGTTLTDATKWTVGDNRSQQMVMFMVDITLYHLHSRISPRNIPDLRVKRYDEAINWLKKAGKGDITASLPLRVQPTTYARIRFGSNPKLQNRY